MMLAWILVAMALLASPRVTLAAEVVKVWDASHPTRFAGQLPVRVQALAGGAVRVLSKDGNQVTDGSLCGASPLPGSLQPWTNSDMSKGVPGHCGEARFSRDGSLAVLTDASVRDKRSYVRGFDVAMQRFTAAEYRPDASFWSWALGESAIACFVDVGRDHVLADARCLRLEVIRAAKDHLEVTERWQDSTYVHLESADMNDAGVIVALVATAGVNALVARPMTWAMLVVPAKGVPSLRPVSGLDRESRVAISEDGHWIATTRGEMDSVRVDLLDASTLEQVGESISVSDFIEARLSISQLAVSNRRAVALSAHVSNETGSSETRVILARGPRDGEALETMGRGYRETVIRFVSDRHLFVGTAGLPALVMTGINGAPDQPIPPVAASACVYRY